MIRTDLQDELTQAIRVRRKERYRLLSTLYVLSDGGAGKSVSLDGLRRMVGLESEEAFVRTLRTLESYRQVQVYNEEDRGYLNIPRWDDEARAKEQRLVDSGGSGFFVELTEQGHLAFEYMALNPGDPVEPYGVRNELLVAGLDAI